MSERLIFCIDKKIYYVPIVRWKKRRLSLQIKDDEIICSAPDNYSDIKIKMFVNTKIKVFIKKLNNKKINHVFYSLIEDYIIYFGKKIPFIRLSGFSQNQNVLLKDNVFYIHTLNSEDSEVKSVLLTFLAKEFSKFIIKRHFLYEKKMKTAKHSIKCKWIKSK
jgi:predicted metal-dependent hydrolase